LYLSNFVDHSTLLYQKVEEQLELLACVIAADDKEGETVSIWLVLSESTFNLTCRKT
jgi:hypothetical protein